MSWDYDEATKVIEKLQAIEDYDEAQVLEVIHGIGYDIFQVLDEKPGYFGYDYRSNGEWHWKLRRARNSAPTFFEVINA